jgi:hypothetical protein
MERRGLRLFVTLLFLVTASAMVLTFEGVASRGIQPERESFQRLVGGLRLEHGVDLSETFRFDPELDNSGSDAVDRYLIQGEGNAASP